MSLGGRPPDCVVPALEHVLGFAVRGHKMERNLDTSTCKAYFPSVRNEVRVLRTELGLTQAELAQRLNVSRQTVNAIEAGRYNPTLPLAISIARLFGRAVEEVFHVDD